MIRRTTADLSSRLATRVEASPFRAAQTEIIYTSSATDGLVHAAEARARAARDAPALRAAAEAEDAAAAARADQVAARSLLLNVREHAREFYRVAMQQPARHGSELFLAAHLWALRVAAFVYSANAQSLPKTYRNLAGI
jgi:hypothetical protein